ncbi:MAG TPA: hypothetical protein VF199_04565 [Bacillales bacterium]
MNRTHSRFKGRLCRNVCNEQGFATIWYLVGIVAIVFVASFVLSSGFSNIQQNQIKHAMDRAVKAAVLQYDIEAVSKEATIHFNRNEAYDAFLTVLQQNLQLNASLVPKDISIFQQPFTLVEFRVVDGQAFPYTLKNRRIRFQHTFHAPGIAAVVKTSVSDLWGSHETTYYVPAVAEINMEIEGVKP